MKSLPFLLSLLVPSMVEFLKLHKIISKSKTDVIGLPGGSVVKNLPASIGDVGLIPDDSGKSHLSQSN